MPDKMFQQLLIDYLIAEQEDCLPPMSEAKNLRFRHDPESNQWLVFFDHQGSEYHTYADVEDLLAWMWSKIRPLVMTL